MNASIDLANARTALGDKPLFGFADVVTAEGIVERCSARATAAKVGVGKPPPPPGVEF